MRPLEKQNQLLCAIGSLTAGSVMYCRRVERSVQEYRGGKVQQTIISQLQSCWRVTRKSIHDLLLAQYMWYWTYIRDIIRVDLQMIWCMCPP